MLTATGSPVAGGLPVPHGCRDAEEGHPAVGADRPAPCNARASRGCVRSAFVAATWMPRPVAVVIIAHFARRSGDTPGSALRSRS